MPKITVSVSGEPVEVKSLDEALGFMKSEEYFRAIGEFIFWFSQLEAHLKARLAGALDLDGELFDIIIAPYDFVTLCTVLGENYLREHHVNLEPPTRPMIAPTPAVKSLSAVL
jgi:hypothetical protein